MASLICGRPCYLGYTEIASPGKVTTYTVNNENQQVPPASLILTTLRNATALFLITEGIPQAPSVNINEKHSYSAALSSVLLLHWQVQLS